MRDHLATRPARTRYNPRAFKNSPSKLPRVAIPLGYCHRTSPFFLFLHLKVRNDPPRGIQHPSRVTNVCAETSPAAELAAPGKRRRHSLPSRRTYTIRSGRSAARVTRKNRRRGLEAHYGAAGGSRPRGNCGPAAADYYGRAARGARPAATLITAGAISSVPRASPADLRGCNLPRPDVYNLPR